LSGLLNAFFFQLRFNPRRCFGLAAALAAILLVLYAATARGSTTSPEAALWDKFIPVSQLGIALSLAYLALPMFRHMTALAALAGDVVGKTTHERTSFALQLKEHKAATYERLPDLHAMVSMFLLVEARKAAKRGEKFEAGMPPVVPGVPEITVGTPGSWGAWNQVRRLYDDFKLLHCVRTNGSRSRFIRSYFVLADVWTVGLGFAFASAILILALIEAIVPTHTAPWLRSTQCQFAFGTLLVIWSCGAPIYFGFQGRRVSDDLEEFVSSAQRQKQLAVQGDEDKALNRVVTLDESLNAELHKLGAADSA
jgi:hypothetical protein